MKEFGNRRFRKDSLTSSLLPETGHKTLMWEICYLHLEESAIFIAEDGGTLTGIGTNGPCKASPSLLNLVHILWSYHIFS